MNLKDKIRQIEIDKVKTTHGYSCTYQKECFNYTPTCSPNTCNYISKFYNKLK